jgi:RNA polymerase sigma factor (sigma-70 family)
MASAHLGAALRQIHGLFEAGTVAGLSDSQLLERYLAGRDESAFAALVMRHGPMVLGVCHGILRGSPEVEDAFQATFLVLIRKAETIRGRDAVGGWLHRVAHRVAAEAGRGRSRRDRRERGTGELPEPIAAGEDRSGDDWRAPLHEELARLPERLRQPIVLCYLEGKTQAQAAVELRWSEATLRRRLAEARGLLRARLSRRGVGLSGAALAAAMGTPATAAVPPVWVDALARAASGITAPAAAARLAGRVVRAQLAARVRNVVNVLTVVAATGLVGSHLIPAGRARAGDPARPTSQPSPAIAQPSPPRQKEAGMEQTLAIRGRVLDPDGQPFAGARIHAYPPSDGRSADPLFTPGPPAPAATSDANGQFRFTMPEPGLDTLQPRATWAHPTVVAMAPGFGPGWASFTTAEGAGDLTLRLVRDDVPIEGRIVDLQGRPVPGATIRPVGVFASSAENLTEWEAAMSRSKDLADGAPGKLSRFLELFRWGRDYAATTGPDGRFRMTGIGRERVVSLWIEGPTIATEFADIHARTRPGPTYQLPMHRNQPMLGHSVYYGATFEHAAAPSRPIEGTVRDKDTGRPIAGVSIRSDRFAGIEISARDHVRTTTGADGRYRLVGMPPGTGNRITANPGPAQPYLGTGADVPGGASTEPVTVDFALQRGLTIRGKVTDKATGRPAAAVVEYFVLLDNPNRAKARALHLRPVPTRPDGSFELEGLPGPGLVAARAAKEGYAVGVGADKIAGLVEGGYFPTDPHICEPQYYHAIAAIDPAGDARSLACDLALDPGITLSGTVIGPDGQPVAGCSAMDLSPPTMSLNVVQLTSSDFTARGLDPKRPRPIVFRHDEEKLTAVVVARGDERGPLTVRLQPAATVTGRLLDEDGHPLRGIRINDRYAKGQFGPGTPFPRLEVSLGEDGRFRIEGLIPGVAYDLGASQGLSFLGDFAAGLKLQPGETRDLGDVKVKEPR